MLTSRSAKLPENTSNLTQPQNPSLRQNSSNMMTKNAETLRENKSTTNKPLKTPANISEKNIAQLKTMAAHINKETREKVLKEKMSEKNNVGWFRNDPLLPPANNTINELSGLIMNSSPNKSINIDEEVKKGHITVRKFE